MWIIALRDRAFRNIVAFAAYRLDFYREDEPIAYLYEIQLAESMRGAKPSIGKALIAEVEGRALHAGCKLVVLSVAEKNVKAIGFYSEGCGYEKFSQRDETDDDGSVVSILEYAKGTT